MSYSWSVSYTGSKGLAVRTAGTQVNYVCQFACHGLQMDSCAQRYMFYRWIVSYICITWLTDIWFRTSLLDVLQMDGYV